MTHLNVSRAAYYAWESGGALPDLIQLVKLCEILDRPPGYFLGLIDHGKAAGGQDPAKAILMRHLDEMTPLAAQRLIDFIDAIPKE